MVRRSNAKADALGAILVFAAAFVAHLGNLGNALLGWDSYATIVASRIESAADLWGTFSEVMMDGRFPFADFYRPVGNLFIAFDYAVWDLDPFGYQLTNLLLWSLSAALVFLFARRILGEKATAGPVVAVVFYVLHPSVLSILPFAARRTETLQIIFVLLTLIALPVSENERRTPRLWIAGLFAALAVGSKETGIIALPLAFAHQFLVFERTVVLDRAMTALRAAVPAAVAIAAVMVARFAAIGGLGGYREQASMDFFERLAAFLPGYLKSIAVTGSAGRASAAGLIAFAVFAVLISAAAWLYFASGTWDRIQRRAVAALAVLGVAWLAGQAGLAAMSFQYSPRYLPAMVAGFSLALAALAEGIGMTIRAKDAAARPIVALAAVSAAVALLPGLAGSASWYGYPAFAEASRIQENELRALTEGMRTRPLRHPTAVTVRRQIGVMDSAVDHAWMLSPWGLQAWLDMSFPGKPVEVRPDNRAGQSRTHWNLVLVPVRDR